MSTVINLAGAVNAALADYRGRVLSTIALEISRQRSIADLCMEFARHDEAEDLRADAEVCEAMCAIIEKVPLQVTHEKTI